MSKRTLEQANNEIPQTKEEKTLETMEAPPTKKQRLNAPSNISILNGETKEVDKDIDIDIVKQKDLSHMTNPGYMRPILFEIYANDIERCATFYKNVFSWKLTKGNQSYTIQTGPYNGSNDAEKAKHVYGIDGQIVKRKGKSPAEINSVDDINAMVISFDCANIDETLEKITKNGGNIIGNKMTMKNARYYAYARDTECNVFGIWQNIIKSSNQEANKNKNVNEIETKKTVPENANANANANNIANGNANGNVNDNEKQKEKETEKEKEKEDKKEEAKNGN